MADKGSKKSGDGAEGKKKISGVKEMSETCESGLGNTG